MPHEKRAASFLISITLRSMKKPGYVCIGLTQNLCFALRQLRKAPAFPVTRVLAPATSQGL